MKPLQIKNEDGETIDIKFDGDGRIEIRHHDIDPKQWGILKEYGKRIKNPSLKKHLEKGGIDLSNPLLAGMVNDFTGKAGGYIVLDGKTFTINAHEVKLIHTAVKQAGGIVPNWDVGG